ncbi:MAG: fasciclin domain-containing protein [Rhizobacter sp.]|nr:fasciclin domain-containing protein [Ferruginibacter sp.]
MTFYKNHIKNGTLAIVAAIATITACNKAPQDFDPIPTPLPSPAKAIGDTLKLSADDSLFYKVIVRSSLLPIFNDKAKRFTLFSPNNAAVRQFVSGASGGLIPPSGAPDSVYVKFINTNLPVASAAGIVQYQTLPQAVLTSSFGATFANLPYPTLLNPNPAASPFLRFDGYVSTRTNGAWLNNIPVIAPNRMAGNGIIHSTAAVAVPPSTLLLDRINSDAGLTFLKAAIARADSGAAPGSSLAYLLGTQSIAPGLNLTLFAPTDAAFQGALYVQAYPVVYGQLYQGAYAAAIGGGATPAQADAAATAFATANAPAQTTALTSSPTVFQNPALYPFLTATAVKGILAYHLFFGQRAFTPNLPATATAIPTFLNSAVPAHPGVTVAATFTGPVVSAATVKGLANPTASNLLINPLPTGSSDQHYINGVMHKIDQVLFPQ